MSRLTSQQRKLAYLVIIVILLIPVIFLGRPSAPGSKGREPDAGGWLASLRSDRRYGQRPQPDATGKRGQTNRTGGSGCVRLSREIVLRLGVRFRSGCRLWRRLIPPIQHNRRARPEDPGDESQRNKHRQSDK